MCVSFCSEPGDFKGDMCCAVSAKYLVLSPRVIPLSPFIPMSFFIHLLSFTEESHVICHLVFLNLDMVIIITTTWINVPRKPFVL